MLDDLVDLIGRNEPAVTALVPLLATALGLLLRLDEVVAANERLVAANERLEARVSELERRLNRSSRNSSLPPSHDPPSAPPRPRGKGSGRKDRGPFTT